jgi:hypothetical protein
LSAPAAKEFPAGALSMTCVMIHVSAALQAVLSGVMKKQNGVLPA